MGQDNLSEPVVPPEIVNLASDLLDENEYNLTVRLDSLFTDNKFDASSLISDIVPIYHDESGEHTLEPDPIYRPFMYLANYADHRRFPEITRIFILNACWHLEGCLQWLRPSPPRFRSPSGPFGPLVTGLNRAGVLSLDLAEHLMRYNKAVYVPAHHPSVRYTPSSLTKQSTFSVLEAALSFVLMRKLSIKLFGLLLKHGVALPHGWKEFNQKWLTWDRRIRTFMT